MTTQPEEAARRFPDLMLDNHSENLAPGRGFSRHSDRDDLSTGRKSDDSPIEETGRSFGDDDSSGENLEKIVRRMSDQFGDIQLFQANERRIAKKAALIAKTMKRKEEIETKVDLAEQRNAERRQVENEKKELALRKKVEKEQQRLVLSFLKSRRKQFVFLFQTKNSGRIQTKEARKRAWRWVISEINWQRTFSTTIHQNKISNEWSHWIKTEYTENERTVICWTKSVGQQFSGTK